MLIFSDMSSTGDSAEVQAVMSRREQHAKALEILAGVLQAGSGVSIVEARTKLSDALALRTADLVPYLNDALVKGHLETVKGLLLIADDASFGQRRALLQNEFNLQRQLAVRHQRPR